MSRTFTIWAVFAITLLPIAHASFTDVRSYEWWMMQSNSATGAVAATAITVPADPFSHTTTAQQSIWEISATYTAPTAVGGGTQTFTFQVDGVTITGCTWSVTRGTVAVGIVVTTESHFFVRCVHPSTLSSGAHTITILSTGTTLTTASRTDVMLRQVSTVTDSTLDPLATAAQVTELRTHVDQRTSYTNAQNNATRGQLDAIFARLNTTCQKGTIFTVDCEGIGTLGTAQHSYQNALINATAGGGGGLNMTLVDLLYRIDNNISILLGRNESEVFTMASREIAVGIGNFFWLALMIAGFLLVRHGKTSEAKYGSIVIFIAAALWAAVNFEEAFMQGIGFILGVAAVFWAATVKPVTR